MIIYIGFSRRTHKLSGRILCRDFKHCAPVVITKHGYNIYQFTKYNQITIIRIKKRDITILEKYGWRFVKYNLQTFPKNAVHIHALTCVMFTKKFCGIKRANIQTPDALLKYVSKKY